MKRFKHIMIRLVRPSAIWAFILVVLGFGLMLFSFLTGQKDTPVAYISYMLSAYALTVIIMIVPNVMKKIKSHINHYHYGNLYLNDPKFRARVSLYQGLLINLLYVVFKLLTGLIYASVWFGAIAVYYIILSVIRFFLLRDVRKASTYKNKNERVENELYSYRFCGYLMFILNLAIAGMIIQMIWQDKSYSYPGYIIYASAAFSFYCLVTTIINMVKFRKLDHPVLSAAKMLSFAGALMSIFALQTAMLAQFGVNEAIFRRVMNVITGTSVSIIVFAMAVFMVIWSNKKLQQLRINNS